VRRVLVVLAIAASLFAGAVSAYGDDSVNASHYKVWDEATGNVHRGYLESSTKCPVCHSVHLAYVPGIVDTGVDSTSNPVPTGDTEMLLRTSVVDSCAYCHITTNIGNLSVYEGDETNYLVENDYGHQKEEASCTDCHAPHGANTLGYGAADEVLKIPTDPQTAANGAEPPWGPEAGKDTSKRGLISYACTNCHKYYRGSDDGAITVSEWDESAGETITSTYFTHPMKDPDPNYTGAGTYQGGPIAARGSTYCSSCHDAGAPGAFPHYTENAVAFLLMAPAASEDTSTLQPAFNPYLDGTCLKCHRWTSSGSPTQGVGIDF
jgi:hypothetical protein